MFIIVLSLLAWTSFARAETSIECEHYLHREDGLRASAELKSHLFGLPFSFAVGHRLTPAGRARLGLPADLPLRTLLASFRRAHDEYSSEAPWVFAIQTYADGATRTVHEREFPDVHPVLWERVKVKAPPDRASGLALAEATVRRDGGELLSAYPTGFVTDPDPDGARAYLRTHYNAGDLMTWVEYGLDVPCDRVSTYLAPEEIRRGYGHPVRTPAFDYCRVPALVFARVRLADDR